MNMGEAQQRVGETFTTAFGYTPLSERVQDILGEALELSKHTSVLNVKEEVGDLLASVLQLCNESGWDADEVLQATLDKIRHRMPQYKTLGRKLRVAILGGAFDPVTKGHIEVAKFVLDTSRVFDEVWLTPCFRHMNGKQMESARQRLRMCEIAAKVDGRIKVWDYEVSHELAGDVLPRQEDAG